MILELKPNRVYRSYRGGKRLDALYGLERCEDTQFPEEWIASTTVAYNAGREDIIEGLSVCKNGKLLKDMIEDDPCGLLGTQQYERHGKNLSILTKLLDASERLFIQCHPTIEYAKKYFHSDFGKTECWYIISTEQDSCVYLGFKPEITREKWVECFEKQDVQGMLNLMHKIYVKPGDLVFVDGGVPHAIGAGCLLCELQEPTDYMVIPERTSTSGITLTDKKMNGGIGFENMFSCFIYHGYTEEQLRKKFISHPQLKDNSITTIVDEKLTDKFKMFCLRFTENYQVDFGDIYSVAVVLNGNCVVRDQSGIHNLSSGGEMFIGANSGTINFDGCATIMICQPG